MNRYFRIAISLCYLTSFPIHAAQNNPSPAKIKSLYNSLSPSSISQHLAFFELYGTTSEGQQALHDAYRLLSGNSSVDTATPPPLLKLPPNLLASIHTIIGLINKQPCDNMAVLSDSELALIDSFASRLPNRRLRGHLVTTEDEVISLPSHEIDLSRGLLISQLKGDPDAMGKIRSYEAAIDLMALQILTQVSLQADPQAKIRAINHFIFEEMGFRFPPHSTYAKDIDLYTFLPSVLDSRRGVCLGVSILYICLAQRLGLDLEIIIPPGHIFVRCRHGDKVTNIETTARGIHLPDEEYLGVDLRSLPQCNIKETIGMAHFNQASVYWKHGEYDKVMASYQKAQPYLQDNELLMGLMGFAAILQGNEEFGKMLLTKVADFLSEHAVSKDTMAEDLLKGDADAEGIKAFFMNVDENRESLLAKKEALERAVRKYPRFREGIFSLAGTWLQLHRAGEALAVLNSYHAIDPTNPNVEYYLAALYAERLDYNNAWKHLRLAEAITESRDHHPEALKSLKHELSKLCPE